MVIALYIAKSTMLLRPTSRGTVTIRSSDPDDASCRLSWRQSRPLPSSDSEQEDKIWIATVVAV